MIHPILNKQLRSSEQDIKVEGVTVKEDLDEVKEGRQKGKRVKPVRSFIGHCYDNV